MIIRIKKTSQGAYEIDGNIYLLLGIATFVLTFLMHLLVTWQLLNSLLYSFVWTLIGIPIVYFFDHKGKRKHKKIIHSKLFHFLEQQGFEVENYQEYWALIGEQQGYSIRIYYDWYKLAKGFLSFGDLVIMVYYHPILMGEVSNEINLNKIETLNKQLKRSKWLKIDFIEFTTCFVVKQINYYPFTQLETVQKHVDSLIELLKQKGLKPLSKKELLSIQETYINFYAPGVGTFETFNKK